MASEAEAAKAALELRLAAQQAETAAQPREAVTAFVVAANTAAAAVHLDEAETRKLIDQQLRQAGWVADSATLVYTQGARPEKNKNLAIAEWPTHSGPADYVLFVGLTPIAVGEAKRQNVDVSAALQQARRYSRGFTLSPEAALHTENWGGVWRLPYSVCLCVERASLLATARHQERHLVLRFAPSREPWTRPRRLVYAGGSHCSPETRRRPLSRAA